VIVLSRLTLSFKKVYPPLGADYLMPQITATWIAVCFIFILAGLGLKTSELSNAFQLFRFNATVQIFNFGVVSALVYAFSRGLSYGNILTEDLADGMVVCASLPMTVNMVLVLTKAADGDEAAAMFNAAAGNLVGVALSPMLILGYLGVTGDVDLFEVFYKLAVRVVLPVFVGQVLQKTSSAVMKFIKEHKAKFKKAQQYVLTFIIYTVFCQSFEEDNDSTLGDVFLMSKQYVVFACWFLQRPATHALLCICKYLYYSLEHQFSFNFAF
jgi:sodium/bile acid cotransporter 7